MGIGMWDGDRDGDVLQSLQSGFNVKMEVEN